MFLDPSDYGPDLVHPGAVKLGNLALNYFLSSPYTPWLRSQGAEAIPIGPVPRPLPSLPPLTDMPPGEKYFGLAGGLYPGESNATRRPPGSGHERRSPDPAAR